MKRFILTLTLVLAAVMTAQALPYRTARKQALFLSDKMAYELNLTQEQYEYVYQINLDYFMNVNSYDVYGTMWDYRNDDLRYVLFDWQYSLFLATDYFYRPLRWYTSRWVFPIYGRYNVGFYYYDRPHFYRTYRGGGWHRPMGGPSPYRDHHFGAGAGMRDGHVGPRPEDNRFHGADKMIHRGNRDQRGNQGVRGGQDRNRAGQGGNFQNGQQPRDGQGGGNFQNGQQPRDGQGGGNMQNGQKPRDGQGGQGVQDNRRDNQNNAGVQMNNGNNRRDNQNNGVRTGGNRRGGGVGQGNYNSNTRNATRTSRLGNQRSMDNGTLQTPSSSQRSSIPSMNRGSGSRTTTTTAPSTSRSNRGAGYSGSSRSSSSAGRSRIDVGRSMDSGTLKSASGPSRSSISRSSSAPRSSVSSSSRSSVSSAPSTSRSTSRSSARSSRGR